MLLRYVGTVCPLLDIPAKFRVHRSNFPVETLIGSGVENPGPGPSGVQTGKLGDY